VLDTLSPHEVSPYALYGSEHLGHTLSSPVEGYIRTVQTLILPLPASPYGDGQ